MMEGIFEGWFNQINCSLEVNFLIDQLSDHVYHTSHFRSATYSKLTLLSIHFHLPFIIIIERFFLLDIFAKYFHLEAFTRLLLPSKAQGIPLLYSVAAGIVISILFIFRPVSCAVMVYMKKNICCKKKSVFPQIMFSEFS